LILLDTHVLIWLAQDYQRLSAAAHAAITEARKNQRGLAISSITLIETARLASHKRVNLAPDLETFLLDVEQRFIVLPITANIALQAFEFPGRLSQGSRGPHHRRDRANRRYPPSYR